ncbi:hypothetical protein PG996_008500 [Apiospora saccharicola]|uniref:Uncharacterized protein n=1 Tax=Apiospora saccharicola TaxID=335842 RepID=A0ABR1UY46_9PEZI
MHTVTKLTGPHWCSSSPAPRGQDEPAATKNSREQVAGGQAAIRGGEKNPVDDREEWDLVANPGRDADNERDNSRVAQCTGYMSKFNLEVGRGEWRVSLLSWERRVGTMVQKNRPECRHTYVKS